MMKQEFEQLVGKEVSQDTFELYNTMYMALPESINKLQFVTMLDKNMIPEDPAAVERKARREEFIASVKKDIADAKEQLKFHRELCLKALVAKKYWKGEKDDWMYESYKRDEKYHRYQMKEWQQRINELKFIIQW